MAYEKLNKDSKELVRKILDAAEEERGLLQQIQKASSGSAVTDNTGMALAENTALVPPEALQMELKEKRAEMAGYMKEAVKIGLGELPMIKNNYKRYVGEELPA